MSLKNYLAQPSGTMWITELLPKTPVHPSRRPSKPAPGSPAKGRLRAGSSDRCTGRSTHARRPSPERTAPVDKQAGSQVTAKADGCPKAAAAALPDVIRSKRERLASEVEKLPEMLGELEQLRSEWSACTRRHQLHRRTVLQQRIRELEAEVDEIQSGRRLQTFLERSAPYMRAYQKQRFCHRYSSADVLELEPPIDGVAAHTPDGAQDTLAAYLRDVEEELPPLRIEQQEYCKACASPMQLYTGMALLVCAKCGAAEPHLDATVAVLPYNDDSYDYSSMTSKRISHWIEWVRTIQGKEAVEIPDDVLALVMDKLHVDMVPKERITVQGVRDILKRLRLRKYYEHVQLITSKITGVMPPRLTPAQEEKLKMLFMAASHSFQKYCPESRQNFLSYSYVFSKLAGLMGLYEFEPFCTTLKGQEKLQKADAIFKKICEDQQWRFVPSVTAGVD